METKDLPLNMPCSDPEGCKHFKNEIKLQERIKELETESTLQRNALTWIVEESSSDIYNQSEILNMAEQALKGGD